MDNLILEYKNLCRTCICSLGENDNFTNIFDGNINNISLLEIIVSVSSLDIFSYDNLPDKICNKCLEHLKLSYEFKKMCKESDQELRARLHTYMPSSTKQECKIEVGFLSDDDIDRGLLNDNDSSEENSNLVENTSTKNRKGMDGGITFHFNEKNILETSSNLLEKFPGKQISRAPKIADTKYCSQCNLKFPSVYKFERHKETHKKKTFNCTNCEKIFPSKKTFMDHKITHSKEYKCSQCGKLFEKSAALNSHMKVHVPKKFKLPEPKYVCTLCCEKFATVMSYRKHRKTHDTHDRKEFKCKKCGEIFLSKSKFLTHSKTHKEKKPRTCHICEKTFTLPCRLREHLLIHTGETPHLCPKCGKAFNKRQNLNEHMIRHTGLKPVQCPQCPSRFSCKGDLNSHMRTHNNIKPHVCNICGSSYAKNYYLKKHYLTHNEDTTSVSVKTEEKNISGIS